MDPEDHGGRRSDRSHEHAGAALKAGRDAAFVLQPAEQVLDPVALPGAASVVVDANDPLRLYGMLAALPRVARAKRKRLLP